MLIQKKSLKTEREIFMRTEYCSIFQNVDIQGCENVRMLTSKTTGYLDSNMYGPAVPASGGHAHGVHGPGDHAHGYAHLVQGPHGHHSLPAQVSFLFSDTS